MAQRLPLRAAAHGGDRQPAGRGPGFEIIGTPLLQGLFHASARGVGAGGQAQQRERAIAVMVEIRMNAHPARRANGLTAGIEPGDRRPQIGLHAVQREIAAGLEGRVLGIDRHALQRPTGRAPAFDLGRGQRGGAGADLRGLHHLETARKSLGRSGQGNARERVLGQALVTPKRGQRRMQGWGRGDGREGHRIFQQR